MEKQIQHLNSIVTQFVLRLFRDAERKMSQLLVFSKSYCLTFLFLELCAIFKAVRGADITDREIRKLLVITPHKLCVKYFQKQGRYLKSNYRQKFRNVTLYHLSTLH